MGAEYVKVGSSTVLKVSGLEIPEEIDQPGRDGAEARASYAYALYVRQQILRGEPVESYGGEYGGRDARRAEAFAGYVVQQVLREQTKGE